MTASQAATRADRLHDRLLAACWPPPERKRRQRPCQDAAPRITEVTSRGPYIAANDAGQRAIAKALIRASDLDRRADLLLALNVRTAAERLAHRAAEIRQAVSA